MGAEHAVGRAPAGAPTPVGVPPERPHGDAMWPPLDSTPASPGRGPQPPRSGVSAQSPASGAIPLAGRRRPRLPRSVLLVVLGVALVVAFALLLGTRAGAGLLAVELLVCAVARAVLPAPGPNALAVRSRALDVLVLGGFAVVLGALALVLPGAG